MPTSDPQPLPYAFFFGPFRFASALDIPELRASTGPGRIPVTLRLGGVPTALDAPATYGSYAQLTPAEYLLDIPGTARYYVRNGREVCVDIAPGAPIANVSTYLLGSVFGALCHQNALLPLHASAVQLGGSVVAFLGESGAGKSTLAACLQRRGHRIVSDDICLLESHPTSGAMSVIPVAGWLKLWNRSLEYLGQAPDERHRVFSTDDKFRVYIPGAAANPGAAAESGPVAEHSQLARVVFLARAASPDAPPSLTPLDLPTAIAGLMDMTYAAYVPALTGQDPRVFRQCARLFQHAKAFCLTVPWDLARLDAVLDLLDRDIFAALTR